MHVMYQRKTSSNITWFFSFLSYCPLPLQTVKCCGTSMNLFARLNTNVFCPEKQSAPYINVYQERTKMNIRHWSNHDMSVFSIVKVESSTKCYSLSENKCQSAILNSQACTKKSFLLLTRHSFRAFFFSKKAFQFWLSSLPGLPAIPRSV